MKINVEKTLKNGKEISMKEALSDVTPIEWSKDVLDGLHRDQAIAGLSSQESLDVQGPVLIKRKF